MRLVCLALCLALSAPLAAQTFSLRSRTYPVGPNPSAIAARDLNGDGILDIVTADRGVLGDPREQRPANDELSILLGAEDLGFTKLHPSLKTDFGPYDIALANIDALKWPDIIIASFHATRGNQINLFLNLKQEGIFKPVEFSLATDTLQYFRQRDGEDQPLYTKPGLTALQIADINGDSLRDLVATGWASDVILILPGDAETYFGEPIMIPAPGAPRDLQLVDIDRDGHLDIAAAMYAENAIALWKGDGAFGFTDAGRFPTRGRLPVALQAADFNGDNHSDLAVAHSFTDDSVVVFYGGGDFRFGLSEEIMLGKDRETPEQEIRDLVAADFNGDGRPDLAAACFESASVQILHNEAAAEGALPHYRIERYTMKAGRPRALCPADLDSNGSTDIAIALWEENAVALLMGK